MDMGGGMDMGNSTKPMKMNHKMWMWFHTQVEDTVLFDFWTVNTAAGNFKKFENKSFFI